MFYSIQPSDKTGLTHIVLLGKAGYSSIKKWRILLTKKYRNPVIPQKIWRFVKLESKKVINDFSSESKIVIKQVIILVFYPPIIKRGWLENPQSSSVIFPFKPPFSSGIFHCHA